MVRLLSLKVSLATRRMSAFAKASPSSASDLGLVWVKRDNFDIGAIEQQIELAPTCLALAALDHDRGFQEICRRKQALRTGLDRLGDVGRINLVQQHGNDRRTIDNHQRGSPCWS